ncbi:MarR family winged helix-turn-helix transcriptional regulator [Bacillus horti]|uniref:DNA-binding MarR family transcriptional regulator n=1 Tax=Caldalkalibacillus horti TaxID=77523 RepID=A0ABT9VV87_9BACI|nr:MarR family transcriptional regulator [Bacillus horti]MDQ0164908.1 DNA-binding MarR family transcriptional regulator [Bacillus horti]
MNNSEKEDVRKETVDGLIEVFTRFKRQRERELSKHITSRHKRSEETLLKLLYEKSPSEGMKVSELSALMCVTSPFVTQLLTSMEENGLITRENDKNDRRIVRVFLTEQGTQTALDIQKSMYNWFSELALYLGETDSKQLTSLMHKVYHFIETSHEHKKEEQSNKSEKT